MYTIPSFIRKLYEIVSLPGNVNIITWTQEGDGILIKNIEALKTDVLPQVYKLKNFNSFVRQLNMYNFKKEMSFKSCLIFKHPYFKKGLNAQLCMIKRKLRHTHKKCDQVKTEVLEYEEKIREQEIKAEEAKDANIFSYQVKHLGNAISYLYDEIKKIQAEITQQKKIKLHIFNNLQGMMLTNPQFPNSSYYEATELTYCKTKQEQNFLESMEFPQKTFSIQQNFFPI